MRFTLKLVLSIIAIMACILSFSRYFLIRQSFINSLEKSASQNVNQHILQKYYIESNVINSIEQGDEITTEKITEYVKNLYMYMGESSEKIILYDYDRYEIIFSNFEPIEKLDFKFIFNSESGEYYIKEANNKYYMLFPSKIIVNSSTMYIINIYDVSYIYEERNKQMQEVIFADAIILGGASIFIMIFSAFMTKPIKNLNVKAKKIAEGDFSNRVSINSKDEIGELANSFNIMSEEIENKINSLKISIKQKDDFINGFTHELKTPMTAIMGYSDMLRLKKCDEEVAKKAINYIYNETKRLEKLSHKLMELVSLSKNEIEFEYFDIKKFMNKVSEKMCNLDEIELELCLENGIVHGEKDLLEVVIRNLVENAKKAEPKDKKIVIKRTSYD